MSERDPYVLLGVSPDCTDAELRRAYRALARELHPDHNPHDPVAAARFADVAWAYAQVQNPEARAALRARTAPSLAEEMRHAFTEQESRIPLRGADQVIEVTVSFAESFSGTDLTLEFDARELCQVCGGSGAAPGAISRRCVVCRGQGMHAVAGVSTTCGACAGQGFIIDQPCVSCQDGMRDVVRERTVRVTPGVRDGARLVLAGEGEPGREVPGDLVVVVHVAPSAVFERMEDGGDLLVEVPVTYAEACLGAQLRVPAPDRIIMLTLPPGTPSHTLLRARECGLPRADGTRGDLYIRPAIIVPAAPTGAVRRLIAELGAYDEPYVRAELLGAWSAERESAPPEGTAGDNKAR